MTRGIDGFFDGVVILWAREESNEEVPRDSEVCGLCGCGEHAALINTEDSFTPTLRHHISPASNCSRMPGRITPLDLAQEQDDGSLIFDLLSSIFPPTLISLLAKISNFLWSTLTSNQSSNESVVVLVFLRDIALICMQSSYQSRPESPPDPVSVSVSLNLQSIFMALHTSAPLNISVATLSLTDGSL